LSFPRMWNSGRNVPQVGIHAFDLISPPV
jgi:hypothetical protein